MNLCTKESKSIFKLHEFGKVFCLLVFLIQQKETMETTHCGEAEASRTPFPHGQGPAGIYLLHQQLQTQGSR